MADLKKLLRDFNVLGYADPNTKYLENGKGGKILKLTIDQFTYEDEFFGGEPYCGNETIWENDKPVFRCVYWGKFEDGIDPNSMYPFLKKALAEGPSGNCVHRGPEEMIEGDLKYTNNCTGDISKFIQEEKIFINDKEIYSAWVLGGYVNQQ